MHMGKNILKIQEKKKSKKNSYEPINDRNTKVLLNDISLLKIMQTHTLIEEIT